MKIQLLGVMTLTYKMASDTRQQASAMWPPFGSASLPFRHSLKTKDEICFAHFFCLMPLTAFGDISSLSDFKVKGTSVPSDNKAIQVTCWGSSLERFTAFRELSYPYDPLRVKPCSASLRSGNKVFFVIQLVPLFQRALHCVQRIKWFK